MAKRTLYEILGIPPSASAEEVLVAYQTRKQALQNAQDEERGNHLAFLEYAREHLTDPEKRARYDRTLEEAQPDVVIEAGPDLSADRGSAPTSILLRLVLLSVLAVASAYAWQRANRQPQPPQKSPSPAPIIPASNEAGEGLVFEPSPSASGSATSGATSAPGAAPGGPALPKRTYYAESSAVDADLVKKLALSVYAVVGPQALGTGVVVDHERLLTNCHVLANNARYGKMYAVNTITREKAEITEVAYLDHQDACLIRAPGITGQAVAINNFANMTTSVRTHNIGFARGELISAMGNFKGWAYRFGQKFLVSDNYCDHGVSGGPLVDDEGRLLGLTTGGPADKSYCLSVTADTISALKFETSRPIGEFPENYTSNVSRRN